MWVNGDEDGTSGFLRRTRSKGDVEKEVKKYAKLHNLPFDMAFTQMWEEKHFSATLSAPWDLSVADNLEEELNRAFLTALDEAAHSNALKRKYKKMLEVETGKTLDSKKEDLEFATAMQLATAVQSSLHRCYEYYSNDMSDKEKIAFLERSKKVMLRVHMDVQKFERVLEFITSRMKAFVAEVMRPGYGRTVKVDVNGNSTRSYDKDLVDLYDKKVRSYLTHNEFVVSRHQKVYIPGGACWQFNFGLGCIHAQTCTNEAKLHVIMTHWCICCAMGPEDRKGDEEKKVHPMVSCRHFRATWRPTPITPNWDERDFDRPNMEKMIELKQARASFGNRNFNRPNGGGGRYPRQGGGNGGRPGRGRGKPMPPMPTPRQYFPTWTPNPATTVSHPPRPSGGRGRGTPKKEKKQELKPESS